MFDREDKEAQEDDWGRFRVAGTSGKKEATKFEIGRRKLEP
jgi:hypothetical protein